MVDEELGSGSEARAGSAGAVPAPHGFSIRFAPADLAGHWHDVVELSDGRTGVLVGCCGDPASTDRLRTATRSALLQTADPVRSLSAVAGSGVSALCAVIDGAMIGYSGCGDSHTALAEPDSPPQLLNGAADRLVERPLRPGATVLLCTGPIGAAAAALDGCEAIPPDQVADQVITRLDGVAAVLYRHPPEPLTVTLPAEPSELAVSRGLLRRWLAAAGVDPESCADLLLAAGEATANATEHAVVGAAGKVTITVTATLSGNRLHLVVSDTGAWKPPPVSSGNRGHGLPLINALVDSAELTTSPEGTTVAMFKELRP